MFFKAPPPGRVNLSPYSGLQFFGEVNIDARGAITVDLRDINGVSVFSKSFTRGEVRKETNPIRVGLLIQRSAVLFGLELLSRGNVQGEQLSAFHEFGTVRVVSLDVDQVPAFAEDVRRHR